MGEISTEYDYVIIGSGFGGSVSALRLAEKGYSVLVIEKGKWYKAEDFPKNNWKLKRWIWEPRLGLFGFFKITYLNHVTVLSGVGVGGGSLTYANTLPIPKKEFFTSGSWSNLKDWETELSPHYQEAYRMLGAEENPHLGPADELVRELAKDLGRADHFIKSKVAVHFGKPGETIRDPYFDGKGPDRTGCIHCGACMTGCRHNAKNTLDKNYLHLAQQLGTEILAEREVYDIKPFGDEGGKDGYHIFFKKAIGRGRRQKIKAKHVVFAGGVLGTVPLLLNLKQKGSLPRLSNAVGRNIRTNNESLFLLTNTKRDAPDNTEGIAIGSILDLDENSHLEPVRYGRGSSFFRLLTMPAYPHTSTFIRVIGVLGILLKKPLRSLRTIFANNYSERSVVLLFMQSLDSTLSLKLGKITRLKTSKEMGTAPSGFIPEAAETARKLSRKTKSIPYANITDVFLGTPTTAHILGGAVMGATAEEGVIDHRNQVFGYDNMMVCDGSMISANPGVNPSLSITAISELAMSAIPDKKGQSKTKKTLKQELNIE